jgi:glycerophosphoryl diester phosphodiesterase
MMRPLGIAHRGASAGFPENTLPAFERAIEVGADLVDFDVHARSDGEFGGGLATTVYTVNEPARMLELARAGVTGLFTDVPGEALACRSARWKP